VGAEDHGGAVGHLVQLLDEDRPALLQVVDHVAVVHDLVAHVDRRAQGLDGTLDDLDPAVDAGAETAGIGDDDVHGVHSTRAALSMPWSGACSAAARTAGAAPQAPLYGGRGAPE